MSKSVSHLLTETANAPSATHIFRFEWKSHSVRGSWGKENVRHRERMREDYGMKEEERKMENFHINMTAFGTQCSKLSLMGLNVILKINWSFACCY